MSDRDAQGGAGKAAPRRRPDRAISRRLSRRLFMALLAAGTAGVAAAPARALAAPRRRPSVPAAHRTPAIEKGIAEQKTFLAQQLKVIRDFPLPPGSNPAFVFAPLAPRRRARGKR